MTDFLESDCRSAVHCVGTYSNIDNFEVPPAMNETPRMWMLEISQMRRLIAAQH